jgi:hypothetical protein
MKDPARRALRLLAGGRALAPHRGGWAILAADGSALMRLDAAALARLAALGAIVGAGGGWTVAEVAPPTPRIARARAPAARAGRPGGRGFPYLVARACAGEGPLSARGAAAGLRLAIEAEEALRDPALGMNWDAVPADRTGRGAGSRPPASAERARARLAAARAALGAEAFALCWRACVEGRPLARLGERAGPRLAAALEQLAAAFDRAAAPRRGAEELDPA